MLLSEIKEAPGTYAGVRLDDDTVNAIKDFIEKNEIPNPPVDFHTTLLYSKKNLPNYHPITYDNPLVGKPTGINFLGDDSTIVLHFDCPDLSERHSALRKEHDAPWEFDEYKPHITLSYKAKGFDVDKLPKFTKDLKLTSEYQEALTESEIIRR